MADHYPSRGPDPYAVLGRRVLDALDALAPGQGQLPAEADFAVFAAAVMPVAIDAASFVAVYGPAKKSLPG
jgi:hypothetical protein